MSKISESPAWVRIGRRSFFFTTYAEVSAAYRKAIDESGATSSGRTGPLAPDCTIHAESGRIIAHVSYNGRVWACRPGMWQPGMKPIFDPSGEAWK